MSLERSELMRSAVVEDARPPSLRAARAAQAVVVLALIALGVFIHRENFSYGLVGNDTYPQILTSRVESAGDLWDNLSEPLAEGYLEASFYRPAQSLSIALDEALWGLRPIGYQLSTMLAFAACIALLYLTIRKLIGGGAWLAPLVGTLFFVLHPTLLTVLPAPCRRAELLVSVFLLAALLVLPTTPDRRSWMRFMLAGLFVLLASASKEIGVMGFALVFLHQLLIGDSGRLGRRIKPAALATLPALAGAALYLVARTIVLGGLGGYYFKDPEPFFELLPRWCAQLTVDVLCPWSFVETWAPLKLALLPLIILGLLTAGFLARGLLSSTKEARRAGRSLVIGVAWIVPLVVVLGLNQLYGPWYALVPVIGLSLVVAGLVHGTRSMLAGRSNSRVLCVVAAAALLTALVVPLYASPLYTEYAQWSLASELLERTQTDLGKLIDDARDGECVTARVPVRVTPRAPRRRPFEPSGERPRVYGVVIFKHEGVSAWVELRYPAREIRVVWDARPPLPRPRADEVLLLAYPDRSEMR
jgi:hypothetical protein